MSTIAEVALEAVGRPVPRRFEAVAERVQSALEAREQDIFANLVESAVGFGVSRDQAHLALINAGLTAPCEGKDDVECLGDQVARLTKSVDDALAWARTKGYRG